MFIMTTSLKVCFSSNILIVMNLNFIDPNILRFTVLFCIVGWCVVFILVLFFFFFFLE